MDNNKNEFITEKLIAKLKIIIYNNQNEEKKREIATFS